MQRKCRHCGKPIVLVPSAAERARKYGGKPSDYANLFQWHDDCQLQLRQAETTELLQRKRAAELLQRKRVAELKKCDGSGGT